jgi:hypothetical protein
LRPSQCATPVCGPREILAQVVDPVESRLVSGLRIRFPQAEPRDAARRVGHRSSIHRSRRGTAGGRSAAAEAPVPMGAEWP